MQTQRLMLAGLALGLLATAAHAFQESQTGAPPAAGAPAAPLAQKSAPAGQDGGTEIRIPGLGKLGVLPKLDFGMELLYGAAERERFEEKSTLDNDNLTVKGTIKHKF